MRQFSNASALIAATTISFGVAISISKLLPQLQSLLMTDPAEEAAYIEKLYEYGEQLNNAKDKSQNVQDYQGIIDAAKMSVKAKQLVAQLIPKFYKFFPDLSGPALDAHLGWVEVEVLGVHVQAIRGLPLFCKDTPENIGKMVDILVQILGSG